MIDGDDEPQMEDSVDGEDDENAQQHHLQRSMRNTALFADAEIKTSDPSQFFEIKHEHKLGEGGFAKVFKVKRRSDDLVCALKFCEPKTNSDRNLIINEIGLMN